MTEKQKSCIDWICDTLGVKYFGKDTKQDAWKFINKFIDKAKEVARENAIYEAYWAQIFFCG